MTFLEVAIIIAEKEDRVNDSSYLLMLIDRIILWRNTILRQTLTANPKDIEYYLDFYKLELIKVNSFESGYDIGCPILRTKNKIYKSLRVGDYVYMVSNSDFTVSFPKSNSNIKVSLNRKYTKGNIFYSIRNEYIYIYNTLDLPEIGISDCLESPEKIELDKDDSLFISNLEIKCTNDVIQKIMQAIWAEDLRVKDNSQEETLNQEIR